MYNILAVNLMPQLKVAAAVRHGHSRCNMAIEASLSRSSHRCNLQWGGRLWASQGEQEEKRAVPLLGFCED